MCGRLQKQKYTMCTTRAHDCRAFDKLPAAGHHLNGGGRPALGLALGVMVPGKALSRASVVQGQYTSGLKQISGELAVVRWLVVVWCFVGGSSGGV